MHLSIIISHVILNCHIYICLKFSLNWIQAWCQKWRMDVRFKPNSWRLKRNVWKFLVRFCSLGSIWISQNFKSEIRVHHIATGIKALLDNLIFPNVARRFCIMILCWALPKNRERMPHQTCLIRLNIVTAKVFWILEWTANSSVTLLLV